MFFNVFQADYRWPLRVPARRRSVATTTRTARYRSRICRRRPASTGFPSSSATSTSKGARTIRKSPVSIAIRLLCDATVRRLSTTTNNAIIDGVQGEGRKRNQISVGSCSEVSLPGKVLDKDFRLLNASIQAPSGLEEPCFLKRLPNGNLGTYPRLFLAG